MIEFYINGQQVEVQLENEQTIGDVLKSFESTCEENKAAVIGIIVNDKQITADIFDEEAAKPLGKDTKFEFSVVTKDSIKQSFAALSQLFAELSEQMENVPVALQSGKNKEVSESIKKVAEEEDVDLIVISSSGRTGLHKLLIGSVAEKVVSIVDMDVLLIHNK